MEEIVLEMSQTDKLEEESSAVQEAETTSETANSFWNYLQSEMKVEIPSYVKNIMRLCRLDKPLNFRCIRDDTLPELEKFARKSMIYQLMGVEVNLQDYYGPFHKMPNKFQFPIGDRFLIKQLVACAKGKSDDFWKGTLSPSRRTIAATTTATTTPAATTTTTTTPPSRPSLRRSRTRFSNSSYDVRQEHKLQLQELQQHDDGTSSELELEEEAEKQHEPLDLNQERRKLADIVRSALLKEDYGEGLDSKQVAGRVKVRVTVKSSEEQGVQRELVTGFIKCVFCPTKLMIRRQMLGGRRPRWVISNYRRHIRFHLDGKLKRPSPQDFAKQLTPLKPEFYTVNCDSKMLDADEDNQDDQAEETLDMEPYEEPE